jgi:hypothetical protein
MPQLSRFSQFTFSLFILWTTAFVAFVVGLETLPAGLKPARHAQHDHVPAAVVGTEQQHPHRVVVPVATSLPISRHDQNRQRLSFCIRYKFSIFFGI